MLNWINLNNGNRSLSLALVAVLLHYGTQSIVRILPLQSYGGDSADIILMIIGLVI